MNLEIVLVISASEYIEFLSIKDPEESARHLEDKLVEGAKARVNEEDMDWSEKEIVMHDGQHDTEAKKPRQSDVLGH